MTVRTIRWTLTSLLCLLAAVALLPPRAGELAAWSGSPTVNIPISIGTAHESYTQITSDGSGGAIITWTDYRDYNADIYAQRVDSSGTTLWSDNGTAICTASGTQDLSPDHVRRLRWGHHDVG